MTSPTNAVLNQKYVKPKYTVAFKQFWCFYSYSIFFCLNNNFFCFQVTSRWKELVPRKNARLRPTPPIITRVRVTFVPLVSTAPTKLWTTRLFVRSARIVHKAVTSITPAHRVPSWMSKCRTWMYHSSYRPNKRFWCRTSGFFDIWNTIFTIFYHTLRWTALVKILKFFVLEV